MTVPKKSGYIHGLDGWRAISILGVLANHSHTFFILGHSLQSLQDFGGQGVYVFFAISGLLICTRLLEEEALLGRVNLRGFYIRRLLRIQPAAIAYLLAVTLVSLSGWFVQGWKYWFGALFMYRNYQVHLDSLDVLIHGFLTGHFWTLAVEEHFYLLLSLFLFFVRRNRARWLTVSFFVSLAYPFIAHRFVPDWGVNSGHRHTGEQLQFLIPAALLALLLMQPDFLRWARRWLQPGWVTLFCFLYVALSEWMHHHIAFDLQHPRLAALVSIPWQSVLQRLFPLWVLSTVLSPRGAITRFLELSPLRWIGRISYSLYLWHVLFFRGPIPLGAGQSPGLLLFLTGKPWNLIAAVACAIASFYLLERPLMRLGHRLAPPSTPGRDDMQAEPSIELQPSAS